MSRLDELMKEALGIGGAFAAAVSDFENGTSLGAVSRRRGFDADLAGALHGEVVKAKLATARALGISTRIEDILISLEDEYHLIRPVPETSLFFYLALDRAKANLAMARLELRNMETNLVAEALGVSSRPVCKDELAERRALRRLTPEPETVVQDAGLPSLAASAS